MKKISFTISKVLGKVCPTLSLSAELKSSWNDIIGNDLSELAEFVEAKFEKNNQVAIFINILSSASLIFKYKSEEIKENIKNLTGASEIRFIIKQVSCIGSKDAA